jgi:hypothetical protein
MHLSKTNKKYLNFLQDFHGHCNSNIQFAARDLIKDHKVTTTVTNIMAHGGLIKVSGRGRTTEYTWNSKAPDIRMVIELRKRMTEYHKKYLAEKNKPTFTIHDNSMPLQGAHKLMLNESKSNEATLTSKEKRKYVKKNVPMQKSKSISILWGAFKITY